MAEIPASANSSGTIDVTNTVKAMRQTFVEGGTVFVYGVLLAIPGAQFLGWPVISTLLKAAIHWVLAALSNWSVMQAFFLDTAIRKASQAADYTAAVDAKLNLPTTASKDEYEKAEQDEMAAFRRFVLVSN